jgi:hypothetical protein
LVVGRNNEYATQADYKDIFGELDASGNPVYTQKVSGTAQCTSFNVVTIDRAARKIHCHAFGAGVDRELAYGSSKPAYTNLFNANDPDFKTNSRISDSSGIGSMTGSHVTGFIAAEQGDTIRVRFPNGTNLSSYTRALVSLHKSDKATVPAKTYYKDTDGNVTLDADGLGYTVLVGMADTAWIRCAIYGDYTGAIITKNEPIE